MAPLERRVLLEFHRGPDRIVTLTIERRHASSAPGGSLWLLVHCEARPSTGKRYETTIRAAEFDDYLRAIEDAQQLVRESKRGAR